MSSNLDKFEKELKRLVKTGNELLSDFMEEGKEKKGKKKNKIHARFLSEYQRWFSEAMEVIRQILPNRVVEFERLYCEDKRKKLTVLHMGYKIGCLAGVLPPTNLREKRFLMKSQVP